MNYAKLRKGKLVKAKIMPRHPLVCNEPEAAALLGIYDEYIALRVKDKWQEADELVAKGLKGKGIDVRIITQSQVAVLDPKVLTVLYSSPVTKGGRILVGGRRRHKGSTVAEASVSTKLKAVK